ncbi:MAG: flavodoxin-dependent (E)-4-hydroxy-3-methylbut-2-enyl-diphosphate synthase [Eubacteriales bacterium]|nr:flavodoxin-dependent (E)-4-hydroxy-3-methylbut-2-enyl-diphosphate synthase [Eubacteriales bacterium]
MNKTKQVKIRNITIGGGAPIAIQSMCNEDPHDAEALLAQIRRLQSAGCDIVRLTVPDQEALNVFAEVRKQTDMPLVADIHFDYRLAIGAIEAGADKIRINPGNIGSEDRVRAVVEKAKEYNVPIRVGVNSGSLEKDLLEKYGHVCAEALAESALLNTKMIEDMGYDNLVISIKSSDPKMNYDAYMIAAEKTDHPFHVGVTEAGTAHSGKVKSAVGIGALLLAGIGDTIRVSLTADPVEEVIFGRQILEACGLRKPRLDLVACPTCGRTKIDLEALADQVERRLLDDADIPDGLKVSVMGCVVNGPGEAGGSDYGICGGQGEGLIMVRGKVVEKVKEEELCDELLRVIKEDLKHPEE